MGLHKKKSHGGGGGGGAPGICPHPDFWSEIKNEKIRKYAIYYHQILNYLKNHFLP
jgi:hypothetical protein